MSRIKRTLDEALNCSIGLISISCMVLFFFLISVLPVLIDNKNNGCYLRNGVGTCNFIYHRNVTIEKYVCDTSGPNNCTPYCNCDNCINSEYCNCDYVECNVYGLYTKSNNQEQCEVFVMNGLHSNKKFTYSHVSRSFKTGHTYSMFTKPDNNSKCYEKEGIVLNGKYYYALSIGAIAMESWMIFSFIFVSITIILLATYNCYYQNNVRNVQITEQLIGDTGLTPITLVNINPIVKTVTFPRNYDYTIVNKFDDDDICAICSHQIDKTKPYVLLKCSHSYHKECIDEWFGNNKKTCPICREIEII